VVVSSPTTRLELTKPSASASAVFFIGYYSFLLDHKKRASIKCGRHGLSYRSGDADS
jgi:hypothetical protein